jgi:hypothetical protein
MPVFSRRTTSQVVSRSCGEQVVTKGQTHLYSALLADPTSILGFGLSAPSIQTRYSRHFNTKKNILQLG